jgi:hypothetical protein
MEPLRWTNEVNQPMFVSRQWYMHPVYGPMIIEREMIAFIEPVCEKASTHGADEGFLSLPFPYANYFCNVPPWHNHVQTWYDISTMATIEGLIGELQQDPPKWIFYQRQPEALNGNEFLFNGGKPIPYRQLDRMIEQKIVAGSWKVIYKSSYGGTMEWGDNWLSQEWFLIQTRP